MEYQIQTNSRRCAASGRDLLPGERYYSILVEEEGALIRKDFSENSWQGAPYGAFGFWCGRVPAAEATRRLRIDDDILMECLQRLSGEPDPRRISFRYV